MTHLQPQQPTMEFLPPHSDHVCYVRCSFCNIVLAVGLPSKRSAETVTVKCGRCGNISFFSTRFPSHYQPAADVLQLNCQGFCPEMKLSQPSSTDTSSANSTHKTPFVVKPPEKKHRLPSAYNRFMKEEIQRIKAAKPEIPHREAFSMAAKNWARFDPNASVSGINYGKNVSHESTERGSSSKRVVKTSNDGATAPSNKRS